MSDAQLPINTLISTRCDELGLRPAEVVRRCGYKNISKGLRRLESVTQGCFKGNDALIQALPAALEVAADVVQEAVEATQRQIYEANEAAWRAAFRPHAVILTEKDRPEQIFIAAIIGVDRLLRVDLDPAEGEVTYIDQALKGVRQKLARWNPKGVDVSSIGLGDLPLPLASILPRVLEGENFRLVFFLEAFRLQPGQIGVICRIDGALAGLDLLGSEALFARAFPKLARGSALQALAGFGKDGTASLDDETFLNAALSSPGDRFPAVGLGEDLRIDTEEIGGCALALDGSLVHLFAFPRNAKPNEGIAA
jgi:hypothetical protein